MQARAALAEIRKYARENPEATAEDFDNLVSMLYAQILKDDIEGRL